MVFCNLQCVRKSNWIFKMWPNLYKHRVKNTLFFSLTVTCHIVIQNIIAYRTLYSLSKDISICLNYFKLL
jgi:hypothetical protein